MYRRKKEGKVIYKSRARSYIQANQKKIQVRKRVKTGKSVHIQSIKYQGNAQKRANFQSNGFTVKNKNTQKTHTHNKAGVRQGKDKAVS